MARFASDQDARRLGEALAALRRERGLSQAEAGQRVGMTSQGWGLYEAGRRSGLFRPDVQRRLTEAVEATPEDLLLRLESSPTEPGSDTAHDGLASTGRAFRGSSAASASPPGAQTLQLSSDEMAPWAESGVVVEYQPGRWPRRGQGCVVRFDDGRLLVRLYEGADEDAVYVRTANAAAVARIARGAVAEVSAVTARLERS